MTDRESIYRFLKEKALTGNPGAVFLISSIFSLSDTSLLKEGEHLKNIGNVTVEAILETENDLSHTYKTGGSIDSYWRLTAKYLCDRTRQAFPVPQIIAAGDSAPIFSKIINAISSNDSNVEESAYSLIPWDEPITGWRDKKLLAALVSTLTVTCGMGKEKLFETVMFETPNFKSQLNTGVSKLHELDDSKHDGEDKRRTSFKSSKTESAGKIPSLSYGSQNWLKFVDWLGNGGNIQKPDEHGWLPLHYSVISGDNEIVAFLLSNGTPVVDFPEHAGSFFAIAKNCGIDENNLAILQSRFLTAKHSNGTKDKSRNQSI